MSCRPFKRSSPEYDKRKAIKRARDHELTAHLPSPPYYIPSDSGVVGNADHLDQRLNAKEEDEDNDDGMV